MKKIIWLFFGFTLFSCVTQKDTITTVSNCPETGVCKFQKHKNTSLSIKKDDSGSLYYQKEVTSGKTAFVYSYEQNKDQAHIDGHYIEEIIFEVDDSVFDKDFKNVKPNKILFNVSCFCRGKAGYYDIPNAKISYDKKTKNLTVSVDEIVEGQVLKVVEFSLK